MTRADISADAAPLVFDFRACPEPLNEFGKATWGRLFALQAHIVVQRHRATIRQLRLAAIECDTCGAQPCVNPTFCEACRVADRQVRRQRHRPEHRPTPQTTIEAIMHCVRTRGPNALKEPANVERLSLCDAAAKAQIDARIAKLITAKQVSFNA